MNIGTIVSSEIMQVKLRSGKFLGSIEEYFISRLSPGDRFVFAGQNLELLRVKEMTAYVRPAKSKKRGVVPQWMGGKMPLSSQLSHIFRQQVDQAARGELSSPELQKLEPIFRLQQERSSIPKMDELLIEYLEEKQTHHLFVYPFEGRFIHEVLSALISFRIGQLSPATFSLAFNDYGFELVSEQKIPIEEALKAQVFSLNNLVDDIYRSVNAAEMAKRQFRNIACVSGLVFQGYPGQMKKMRHLQSSTSLIFNVFQEFEPGHFLLKQSYNEVFFNQFEEVRLRQVLQRINQNKIILNKPTKATPFAFPIMVERLRESVSTESLEDRVRRMTLDLEEN
jgi:ATP-dependent Lhr-like helicase